MLRRSESEDPLGRGLEGDRQVEEGDCGQRSGNKLFQRDTRKSRNTPSVHLNPPWTSKAMRAEQQDFRSENGLYSLVKKRHPDTFVTGKDLFSAGLFHNPDTTSVFLTFAAELADVCQKAQPTRTHHFIQKLDRTGKLLRSYTQNVDGFERRLGMESGGRGKGYSKKFTKNVELHGDLGRMRCVLCSTDFPAKPEWMEDFKQGSMPECPACEEKCASSSSPQRICS